MMQKISLKNTLTPSIILIFGIIMRLLGLFSRPIWYDEAFSLLFANTSPRAMIYGTLALGSTGSADIHPLGYYFLLWAWMQVFGNGIVAARLLSISISIFSLILIHQIAQCLFGEKAGNASLALAAILPFQVHYAQEIRMYALLEFCILLATFTFLKGKKGHWSWWILFGLSSAAAQFTHNLAVFYLIALAASPLFEKDFKTLKSVIIAGLFAVLLYTPWLIHLPSQLSKVDAAYWVQRPGFEKIFTLILSFLSFLPTPDQLLFPSLLLATSVTALLVFGTGKTIKEKDVSVHPAIWTAYLVCVPPATLWLASQIVPIYIERALLPSHAIFCIWLGWFIAGQKLPRQIQAILIASILINAGIGIYQHIRYDGFPYAPYELIARNIADQAHAGDIIIHSNKLSYLPMVYYNKNLLQFYITDPKGSKTDTLAPATQEILYLNALDSIENVQKNTNRIWYIIYETSLDEYAAQGITLHPDIEFLEANYHLEAVEKQGDINIYLFNRVEEP